MGRRPPMSPWWDRVHDKRSSKIKYVQNHNTPYYHIFFKEIFKSLLFLTIITRISSTLDKIVIQISLKFGWVFYQLLWLLPPQWVSFLNNPIINIIDYNLIILYKVGSHFTLLKSCQIFDVSDFSYYTPLNYIFIHLIFFILT